MNNYRGSVAAAQAGIVTAAAGTLPFFVISGPAAGIVVVRRITLSGLTLTAVAYASILATKHSTAWTGGSPQVLTQTPDFSGRPAGSPTLCQVYTAGPTGGGTLVGTLAARKVLMQASTPAAAGIPDIITFPFEDSSAIGGIILRSAAESVALAFAGAPATAVSMGLDVEWSQSP